MSLKLASKALGIVAVASLALIGATGCRSDRDDPPPRIAANETPVDRIVDVRMLTQEVEKAPDAINEARAIERLRQYMIRNNLTYKVETAAGPGNVAPAGTPVAAGSQAHGPIRAQMTIYKGQQTLQSFGWMPRDNSNLALLGQ